MSTHGVIVAVRGPREGAVAAAIDAHPALTVARRCADPAEAVAAAAAGIARTVVMSDHPHLTRSVVAQLRGQGVVVIGLPSTEPARQALVALGAAAVAPVDADPDVVASVVAGVPQAAPVPHDPSSSTPVGSERRGLMVAV